MTSKTEACGGVEGGEEFEEEGKTQGSVDAEEPGHLPGDLFTELKRKFTKRVSSHSFCNKGLDQTVTANGDSTDDTQPLIITKQMSLRRFTLSGAADAMKVPLCPKHHRNLELFCRTDLECICVECGQTEHQSHNITCAEKEWQSNKVGRNEE